RLPDAWFGEMLVGDFEKIVSVEFAQRRRDLVEHMTNKLPPPVVVVILAGTLDWRSPWHLFPSRVKCTVELLSIQLQSYIPTDQRIMVAYCFCQKKKRTGGVEKNRFDHFNGIVQRTTYLRNVTMAGTPMLTVRTGRHATIFSW